MSGERLLEAYPLTWPLGHARTPSPSGAQFKVSLFEAGAHLRDELKKLPAEHVVVSSNVHTRADGLPYADAREPKDPGVAVYFDRRIRLADGTHELRPFVLACDQYDRVRFNLRAVGLTIESLRRIARHGATSMMEQAFTGFAALPPAGRSEPWWEVLGVAADATDATILAAFRELARVHHPDLGGDHARMAKITQAFHAASRTLAGGGP